jgi:hypothetical protein
MSKTTKKTTAQLDAEVTALARGVSPCTCGDTACAVRVRRGLVPFCRMDRASRAKPPAGESLTFSSYGAAQAYLHAGGLGGAFTIKAAHVPGSGSPKRFRIVPR